jgi:hypothetical protein
MTDSRLLCAYCVAPVSEGRCPTCRRARAEMHAEAVRRAVLLVVALLVALVAGLVLTAARATA